MSEPQSVAIVGAGIAGLSAALRLQDSGVASTVYEAGSRVGGRMYSNTTSWEAGQVSEWGGELIDSGHKTVQALVRRFGLRLDDLLQAEPNGAEVRRFDDDYFGLPKHVIADLGLAQFRIDRLAAKVPLDAPWSAPKARALDAQTVASWARLNVRTKLGRETLRVMVEAVFSAEPEDISMLHFLFYLHSGKDLDNLLRTGDGAQDSRFHGGSQEISLRMAAELGDVGLSGQAGSMERPLAVTFDNSPADGSCGVLLGFLEGRHGRRAAALTPGERRALVLGDLAAYFGPEALEALDYVEQDWANEEWIRGGYGAHLAPGTWTDYGELLREPEGRIHWAGSETSAVWNGYMDGAVRSGERVAAELARQSGA